jgi:hypothetical protein
MTMRAIAVVLALLAAGCMVVAIASMVTGRPGPKASGLIRVAAVVLFAAAVVLNVASR